MRSGTKSIFSLFGIFLGVWVALRFLLPLFSPFLWGTVLALGAEPMVGFLRKNTRLPRPLCSGIGVTIGFSLVTMVLLLAAAFLIRELGVLAGVLPDLEAAARSGISLLEEQLLALSARTPKGVQPLLEKNIHSLFSGGTALVDQGVRYLLGLAGRILSHVPSSALSVGTGIISAYLISAKLPRIRRWVRGHLPQQRLSALAQTLGRMRQAVAGWLTAQCKLMLVTFVLVALGLTLLRVPHGILWAIGVALVDAFPVLGTGTVLLPWALVSLLQQDTPRALGLVGIYFTVTLIRSVLEPRLVGRHLGLDPLAALAALYVGYQLWGIGGMILAPLLVVAAMELGPKSPRSRRQTP